METEHPLAATARQLEQIIQRRLSTGAAISAEDRAYLDETAATLHDVTRKAGPNDPRGALGSLLALIVGDIRRCGSAAPRPPEAAYLRDALAQLRGVRMSCRSLPWPPAA